MVFPCSIQSVVNIKCPLMLWVWEIVPVLIHSLSRLARYFCIQVVSEVSLELFVIMKLIFTTFILHKWYYKIEKHVFIFILMLSSDHISYRSKISNSSPYPIRQISNSLVWHSRPTIVYRSEFYLLFFPYLLQYIVLLSGSPLLEHFLHFSIPPGLCWHLCFGF